MTVLHGHEPTLTAVVKSHMREFTNLTYLDLGGNKCAHAIFTAIADARSRWQPGPRVAGLLPCTR